MENNKPKPFIRFFINDIKSDLKVLKDIFQGKYKFRYTLLEFIDIRKAVQEYWIFLLIIMLAFFVGRFYESQRCQDECNTFIFDNYLSKEWRSPDYLAYVAAQQEGWQDERNDAFAKSLQSINQSINNTRG